MFLEENIFNHTNAGCSKLNRCQAFTRSPPIPTWFGGTCNRDWISLFSVVHADIHVNFSAHHIGKAALTQNYRGLSGTAAEVRLTLYPICRDNLILIAVVRCVSRKSRAPLQYVEKYFTSKLQVNVIKCVWIRNIIWEICVDDRRTKPSDADETNTIYLSIRGEERNLKPAPPVWQTVSQGRLK